MSRYMYREEGMEQLLEATTEQKAIAEAREILRGGDWGEVESTIWVIGYVAEVPDDHKDGDEIDMYAWGRIKASIDPDEPACSADEHEWHDRQAYGSGGGVKWESTCRHCGLVRRTDTWATDPQDGTQGHTSITYDRGDYDPGYDREAPVYQLGLVIERASDIHHIDLRDEYESAAADGDAPEATRLEQIDRNGYIVSQAGELVWFPASGRAGIAWGGDAVWTDADSATDALRRWANNELVN